MAGAPEELPIREASHVVIVRQKVRDEANAAGFSLVDQTKLVTAASELARNTLEHGRGGRLLVERLEQDGRVGLRLCFEDEGPGIPDLDLALRDGYSTNGGLGLGLSGSRRLVNEFDIVSEPGRGTRVRIARWR